MKTFRIQNSSNKVQPFIRAISIIVLLFSLTPIIYLIWVSINSGFSNIIDTIDNSELIKLIIRTLALAFFVSIISSTLGFFFAFLTTKTNLKFKKIWNLLIVTSLAIPSYVLAYAWLDTFKEIASIQGAIFILSIITTPLVYLYARSAFQNTDFTLEEISLSLGANKIKTIYKIIFPQIKRALLAGVLLSILYVITDFGAVATLRVEVFTWVIYSAYRASFDPSRAAILASILLLITFLIIILEKILRGKSLKNKVGKGVIRQNSFYNLGKWNILFQFLLISFVSCSLLMPIIKPIIWWSKSIRTFPLQELFKPLFNTLWLGFIVVLISILLSFCVAVYATHSKIGKFIEKTTMLIHGLPGIVLGLSFVFLGTRLFPAIYQKWILVVIALSTLFAYLAIGAIKNSLEQYPKSIFENAKSLENSKIKMLTKIFLPLSFSGIKAGGLLILIALAKELPITLLLRPSGENTLATLLWSNIAIAKNHAIAPISLTLIIITIIPIIFLTFIERKQYEK